MMQKNEDQCLDPWVRYHGYLFGFENLFIIDHGSNSPISSNLVNEYEKLGIHITRLPEHADYREKGKFVSDEMNHANKIASYDFLFPIDCDEFLFLKSENGKPTCCRTTIYKYLEELKSFEGILEVKENFLHILGHPGYFWPMKYQKVFFTGGSCLSVDHGSHVGLSSKSSEVRETRLVYAHYHFKPYDIDRKFRKEKLRPWVDVNDTDALRSFIGPGSHLVGHLLETKDEYYKKFIVDHKAVYFKEMVDLFTLIDINPNFSNKFVEYFQEAKNKSFDNAEINDKSFKLVSKDKINADFSLSNVLPFDYGFQIIGTSGFQLHPNPPEKPPATFLVSINCDGHSSFDAILAVASEFSAPVQFGVKILKSEDYSLILEQWTEVKANEIGRLSLIVEPLYGPHTLMLSTKMKENSSSNGYAWARWYDVTLNTLMIGSKTRGLVHARKIFSSFESIGDNCEFGLVQRQAGVENLGLFKWCNTDVDSLVNAFDDKLLGFDDASEFGVGAHLGEYISENKKYGFSGHSFVKLNESSESDFVASQISRLQFLKRKLLEELEEGEKIFVFRRNKFVSLEDVKRLFLSIRKFGPNKLLWVTEADDISLVGTIQPIEDGLYRGYVRQFAPYETAHGYDYDVWLIVCYKIYREVFGV